MVLPSQCEALIGSSKSAAQDIVEGVQIPAPLSGLQNTVDLIKEFIERREARAVDLVLFHHMKYATEYQKLTTDNLVHKRKSPP